MPPKPNPLLHATNAALGAVRPRSDPDKEWQRMQDACGKAFGVFPAGPEVDALHQLLYIAADEPDLSPMGRYSFSQVHVWPRLRNVAQVHHLTDINPAITDEPVDDPIVVVGLPRTATTVTHRLLAEAAGHRGPLMAEMYSTKTEYPNWDAEVRAAARQIKTLYRYAPYFEHIHPMSATRPEETFFCEVATRYFLCSAPLGRYRMYLDLADAVPFYRWLKRVLQVLQYGRQRRRWVLKQPGHLWHLPELMQVFPRAKIVWTHRDPDTVAGSAFSMIEAMRRMHMKAATFRPRPDGTSGLTDIADLWLDLLAEAVERGRTARTGLPAGSVVDVPYHLLTADPDQTVPALYERLGVAWGQDDQDRLDGYFAGRGPTADRRHEYTLGHYGKTPDQVLAAFGDYPDYVARLNAKVSL